MNVEPLTYWRGKLSAERAAILSVSAETQADRRPVELDQQSVGRLSRMDAMQVQAMAQASERRRQVQLRRIEAALKRIDDEEYGYCITCGEPIAEKRLELDPTVPTCIGCAK